MGNRLVRVAMLAYLVTPKTRARLYSRQAPALPVDLLALAGTVDEAHLAGHETHDGRHRAVPLHDSIYILAGI